MMVSSTTMMVSSGPASYSDSKGLACVPRDPQIQTLSCLPTTVEKAAKSSTRLSNCQIVLSDILSKKWGNTVSGFAPTAEESNQTKA